MITFGRSKKKKHCITASFTSALNMTITPPPISHPRLNISYITPSSTYISFQPTLNSNSYKKQVSPILNNTSSTNHQIKKKLNKLIFQNILKLTRKATTMHTQISYSYTTNNVNRTQHRKSKLATTSVEQESNTYRSWRRWDPQIEYRRRPARSSQCWWFARATGEPRRRFRWGLWRGLGPHSYVAPSSASREPASPSSREP